MSEFNIEVQGGSSVRLPTAGKYCEKDIIVTARGGGGTEELQKQLDMYYLASVVLELDNNNNNPMRKTWTYNTIPRIDFSKMTGMRYAFNSSSIEYIDYFINSANVYNALNAFSSTKKFKWMVGIDLSSATNISELFSSSTIEVIQQPLNIANVTNANRAFNGCNALREIRFVEECIKVSIAIPSPVLSAESIQSTTGGLNSEVTGQTLTIPRNAVKKAFETSEGADDGDTSETWNALVASKPNWTITLS